ncbi:hypothetical protein CF018_26125, partial [Escherichia coli]
ADRNRSHWSTSKTPSYTKSVSWQHHLNPGAVLGSGIILRHGVTIGNKYNKKTGRETKCPIIKDNVEFGAYACVIGEIVVGEDSIIGAMSYVDFDVEAYSIISSHRGIVLRKKNA